jgi:hypothetical protein
MKTAIEWLLEKINDEYLYQYYGKEIEQAKEMEKQQIIEAISESNKSNNRNVSLNPEQYYNETFKNK